jgi:hypothetical protein
MEDEDGPKIAEDFYTHLFFSNSQSRNNIPDVMEAARALHLAVKQLREQGCPVVRWAPFIHFGL